MRYCWLYFLLPGAMACEEILNVGADLNWPPYSYLSEQEPMGIDIEASRSVFGALDYCLFFVDMPSAMRAQEQLNLGQIDLLMAASYSDERARNGWFSEAYRHETVVLFTHQNSLINALSVDDAFERGGTFAVNAGSYIGEDFIRLSRAYPEQIVYLSSTEQRLLMLNKGRIDFVVEDKEAGHYISQSKGFDQVFATELVVYQNPIHFMFSRQRFSVEQVSQINRFLKQR
ncbi:substrate-binding periplasmic protein [Planctobacterium marinum]